MTTRRTRDTVLLLAAQALSLGLASAMLVIPANGVFLDAFGARWLPVSYIGIALLGTASSAVIARSLRRWPLPPVAMAVLATAAATLLVTWAVMAVGAAAWPSLVQLVVFPIMIQLGFVIVGGQAGRLLDLQQIKAFFPRIVSGFAIGFGVGGFAAAPLLDVVGAPENLVLLSSLTFVVFLVLVALTARRRPGELAEPNRSDNSRPRLPLSRMLATRLVVLVFAYQVLSAMGSQVLDFLVFDRAAARYTDPQDLTRFVAVYTGVINLVDVVFLAVVAGWLLRRFGLRLGLTANPVFVTLLAAGMVVAALGAGAASLLLFSLVVTARVADITLTDGMTRSSINGVYQLLPVEERMAVQATIEGVGMPVAIGATGVLLLVVDAVGLGTTVIICVALVLCTGWSVSAFVAYGEYRQALGARLRRRGLDLDAAVPVEASEQAAARRLLLTDDVRDLRLGLDLGVTANVVDADLAHLADHTDPDVRLLALSQLAERGDGAARDRADQEVARLVTSASVTDRRAAAVALATLRPPDRAALLHSVLTDGDATVRKAALVAVGRDDPELVAVVVAAVDSTATVEAALAALGRIGTPAWALVTDRVATADRVRPRDLRGLRALTTHSPREAERYLTPLVSHPDRDVSMAALDALARNAGSADQDVLARLLVDDVETVAACLAAAATLQTGDDELRRALDDVVASARARALTVLAFRHGEVVVAARAAIASTEQGRRALGLELLEVSLPGHDAAVADALLRDDLTVSNRLRRVGAAAAVPARDRATWLADLVLDPEGRWASPWLQAVALHAESRAGADVARRHATALAVARDPVLAETIGAVAAPAVPRDETSLARDQG